MSATITTVRPAQQKDVPAIVALVTKTLAEFGIPFGEESPTDEQLLGLPSAYTAQGGAFFVAEIDGTIVGTAGIIPIGVAADGIHELRKMYLDPAARGRGVGQRLLSASLTHARDNGARRIVLDTAERMTAAIAFYEKNGFVRDDAYITYPRCSRGYRLDL